MKQPVSCEEFQETVAQFTAVHKSILDILSKSQEAGARINRAVAKSVTRCGCIQIKAEKKPLPENASLQDLKHILNSHLNGKLCPECREVIESEMGKSLFYLAALCNTLNLDLTDIIDYEHQKISTLRIFNLT